VSKAREALARVRDLPDDELGQALDRAREELFRLRLGNYTNQVENNISLRLKRRELARVLTVQRARELDLESQAEGGSTGAPEAEGSPDDEQMSVADRARAVVGRPKTAAKGKAAAKKPAARSAKKPAAKSTGKAKASAKTSKKKSGKE
jgi:large subunit ribosomal protein L29